MPESPTTEPARRAGVLESALGTFARHGYRATSMEAVAREARISRQGLYFLFTSKEALFREASSHVLAGDLEAVERLLASDAALPERLVAAFDRWAGRYVGPLARDVPAVLAENPDLLDDVANSRPEQLRQQRQRPVELGQRERGQRIDRKTGFTE